jgi:SNF2 family DNA or RNA helicase
VICPKSIRGEWKDEAKKWTALRAVVINGPPKAREFLYRQKPDLFIISYDTAIRDYKLISQLHYNCIILDEAQRIKNCKTVTAQTVKRLRMPPRRYILTATPIENRVEELYSLLEFLGSAVYDNLQRILLSKRGGYSGYYNTSWGSGPGRLRKMMKRAKPENVHAALYNLMLRRRKEDVASELPPKTHIEIKTPLTRKQQELYDIARDQLILMIGDKAIPIVSILAQFTYLREICNSAALIDPKLNHSSKMEELMPRVGEIVSNGHKVIIFSEFKKMCDIIVKALKDGGISTSYIHGQGCNTEAEKKAFWDGNQVLVATRTGEAGHNLQCASYTFNYDIPWNPARLMQREDRAHRIGQDKPVFIYTLITPGTVEERIAAVLEGKRELFTRVIDRPEYRQWLRRLLE